MNELRELVREADHYKDILQMMSEIWGVSITRHVNTHTVRWRVGDTHHTQTLDRYLMVLRDKAARAEEHEKV